MLCVCFWNVPGKYGPRGELYFLPHQEGAICCYVFPPELGGIPGLGGPRYPLWKEDVSSSGNESTLGDEVYEHNNECRAIEVTGKDWSSEAHSRALGAWASCLELPHAHGRVLGGLRVAGFSLFTVFAVLGRLSRRCVGGSGAWRVNCHGNVEASSLTVDGM